MADLSRPRFTLAVVTTADGFIARAPDDAPHLWASPEEQALFFADVAAADWAIMGRNTHVAAERPDRRRIVFSGAAPAATCVGQGDWRRSTQVWLDPEGITPGDLAGVVAGVHPLRNGLILGGTRVHDWFLKHGAIDIVHLTVEPVRFGAGLPLFSGQTGPAEDVLRGLGFACGTRRMLNAQGTVHSVWSPC